MNRSRISESFYETFTAFTHRSSQPSQRHRFTTSGRILRDICNPTRCRRLHCVL